MIRLVVGLGNPGLKYTHTFHNIGFLILDRWTDTFGSDFSPFSLKSNALLSQGQSGQEKIWFMKPQTFMNLSGEAVAPFARYHRFLPEEVLVVYDEVDLDPGRLQVKKGGGSAGHNGLESIFAHWEKDFFRLRVGVGKPADRNVADYVLKVRKPHDLDEIVSSGSEAVNKILKDGVDRAKNTINEWPKNESRQ